MNKWRVSMLAEPVIKSWTSVYECNVNGAELQRAIICGFTDKNDPVWGDAHEPFVFEKIFTFKEHGEFFRGALTMASLRYTEDFYDLLKRYGSIKVTITKYQEKEEVSK